MPELPEVETIVQQLKKKIVGKSINQALCTDKKVVDNYVSRAVGARILDVWRRGKLIIINLSNNHFLLIHLRMTGHFHYLAQSRRNNGKNNEYKKNLAKKHLALTLKFSGGSVLAFHAVRRFERVMLADKQQLEAQLLKFGNEPLSKDFTCQLFKKKLAGHPSSIVKNKLMDQSFIAGVGNIYAQEALYYAGILPQKKVEEISLQKKAELYRKLRHILALSIKNNGTTVKNYSHLGGQGSFQNFLAIYRKEKCPKLHKIERISLGGRGTYYCPRCQQ